MGVRNILFPLFLKCYDITTDLYWVNVFEKLAYGKPPFGTHLVNNTLRCNYVNREFIYVIDTSKGIRIIFQELTKLLETKLDMKSTYQNVQSEVSINSWCDVKKKSLKEMYIEIYVTKLMNKYSMDITVARELLFKIIIYVTLNYISSNNIIYNNNFIDDITNININNGEITIDKEQDKTSTKNTKVINKKMSSIWEKHLIKIF